MRAFGTTLTLGIIAATWSPYAFADAKQECASAYEQTQSLRKEGQLRKARERALVCAQEQCPAVVKKDCAQWLPEIEASTPTVVFEARDAAGSDTSDVKVSFDGELLKERLDGKAVPVDPGQHTFRYEIAGASPIQEQLIIREGDKNRKLAVSFAPAGATTGGAATGGPPAPLPPDQPEEKARGGVPVVAWVLGGVGLVGVGMFATFGILGKNQKADDEVKGTGCAPSCSDDEVSSIRTKLIVADISLGVGVVALGVATYLFITAPPSKPVASTGSARSMRVDFAPAPGGGFATVAGRF